MEKEEKKKLLEEKNIHLWFPGSPVSLCSMKLELDMNVGAIFAYAKFMNVQPANIKSMVCDIICYDSLRNQVDVIHNCVYDGFDIERNKEFGTKVPFKIKSQQTRNVEFVLKSVTTVSGQTWENKDNKRFSTSLVQDSIFNVQADLHRQFIENCAKINADHTKLSMQPKFEKDYWLCACGTLNWSNEENCCVCGVPREWLKENVDKDVLQNQNDQHELEVEQIRARAAEQERLDKERQKEEFRKRKEMYQKQVKKSEHKKKYGKVLPVILILLVLGGGTYGGVVYGLPYVRYQMAMSEYEKGSYDSAKKKFEKLKDYLDSEDMVFKCTYAKAEDYAQSGNYKGAAEMFQSISTYMDADARYRQNMVKYADKLFDQAKYIDAINIYEEVGETGAPKYELSRSNIYKSAESDEKKQYFKSAYEKFYFLKDYKNSMDRANQCLYTVARLEYEKLDFKNAMEHYEQLRGYKDVDQIIAHYATLKKMISAAGSDGAPAVWNAEGVKCPKCGKDAEYVFEFRNNGTYKFGVKCQSEGNLVIREGRFKIENNVLYDAEYKDGQMKFKKLSDIKEVKDNVSDKEGKNICVTMTDPINAKNKGTIKLYGNVISDQTVSLG